MRACVCVYIYIYTYTYIYTYISHIYIMEYYLAIKNGILPFTATWMDLEGIMLSEVSQKGKKKYRMLTHIYGILKKNRYEELWGRTGIKTQT